MNAEEVIDYVRKMLSDIPHTCVLYDDIATNRLFLSIEITLGESRLAGL